MTKVLIDRSTVEQALEALEAAANFFANIDLHESFNPPTANFGSQVEELLIAAEPTLRAALAEPVQEPDSPERRCGGPGCDMTCCQPVQEPCNPSCAPGYCYCGEPVQEPAAFKDAPERIWLQACDDDHCEVPFGEHDEITWWAEQQNPLDVPYVRADLAAPPQRPAEPVQEPDSPERPYEIGARLAREGHGISAIWGAVQSDSDMAEAQRGYENALAEPVQEPVARVRVNSNVPGRINELDLLRPLPRGEHFLYTAPPQRKPLVDPAEYDDAGAAERYNRGLK